MPPRDDGHNHTPDACRVSPFTPNVAPCVYHRDGGRAYPVRVAIVAPGSVSGSRWRARRRAGRPRRRRRRAVGLAWPASRRCALAGSGAGSDNFSGAPEPVARPISPRSRGGGVAHEGDSLNPQQEDRPGVVAVAIAETATGRSDARRREVRRGASRLGRRFPRGRRPGCACRDAGGHRAHGRCDLRRRSRRRGRRARDSSRWWRRGLAMRRACSETVRHAGRWRNRALVQPLSRVAGPAERLRQNRDVRAR